MRTLTLVLLAACGPSEDLTQLKEAGSFGVGFVEEDITYDPGDGERTLAVDIWYPTNDTSGDEARYEGFILAPGVWEGASLADGEYPLVIWSHGHQAFAGSSGRIISHMVRHGMVVVSPEHTGNTLLDGDRTTDLYWKRGFDLSATLDHVLEPGHPHAGQIDDGAIVAMGHSFGAYTVQGVGGASFAVDGFADLCDDGTEFCSTFGPEHNERFTAGIRDERVAGIVAMAPGDHRLYQDDGLADIDVPSMLMTGGLDDVEQGDLQWGGMQRAGAYRVNIADAGHLTFTDVATISDSFIEPDEAWSVIGAYGLSFVRHVREDRAVRPVFNGETVFGDTTEFLVSP